MKRDSIHADLTAYLDGDLSPAERAAAGEHLKKCSVCREELDFLKRYGKAMRSLQSVKAPGDFLQRVHERLERPPLFRRIIGAIFLPLRIKLPLEAAGLAAVCALVLFVIYPALWTERAAHIAYEPDGRQQMRQETDRDVQSNTRLAMRESRKETAVMKRKAAVAGKPAVTETWEIALLVSPESTAFDESKMARGEAAAPLSRMKLDDTMPMEEMEKSAEKSVMRAEKKEMAPAPAAPKQRRVDAEPRIEKIVRESGGVVLSKGPAGAYGTPHFILVEIPARNYVSFTSRLGVIGKVRTAPVPAKDINASTAKIRIKITITQAE